MKNTAKYCSAIMLLLFSFTAYAQSNPGKSRIGAVGRYTATGAELRWIPDNKTILRLGFDNSYTIERSEAGLNKFENIATVKAFAKPKWETLIASEKDPQSLDKLELAMEFLFADNKGEQTQLNLDQGIADLNERKSKEDMIYAVFVFTAIREAKVAEALGLGFIDKTVQAGKAYDYRIILNAKSSIYSIDEGELAITAVLDNNKYKNEVFVYPGDKQLSFAWPSTPEIAGYYVERAAEGETVFKPLNSTPFYASSGQGYDGPTNGAFNDDSLTNYKWYRYRFYGNTAFGEKVLFAEVKGMPRDLTPPNAPIIKQPRHVKPKEVQVDWEIHGELGDLKGFIVARSNSDRGNFDILHKTLLPIKTRNYIDGEFSLDGLNYYIVYAIDTAGNLSASYPGYVALIDSIPPAKPEITSAIIDSLGIVTITIKQGKEKDLKGYKLFKANSTEHEFSPIEEAYKKDKDDTSSLKLILTDTVTLQSLTPKIYYRIRALDFNYNQSAFSEIVAVTRPDTIPPVTPLFNDVLVMEKAVQLHFVQSSSADVKEHMIYRKTELKSAWEILKVINTVANKFIDTSVTQGVTYYYSMRAMDQSGLYSNYASEVYGKPYDSGLRPSVENLVASIEDKQVVLKWNYPSLAKEVFFVIYKKNETGQLMQYATATEKTFTDKNAGNENAFAIKARTKDGGQSNMSELISISKQ